MILIWSANQFSTDLDQRQRDGVCECDHVLQGKEKWVIIYQRSLSQTSWSYKSSWLTPSSSPDFHPNHHPDHRHYHHHHHHPDHHYYHHHHHHQYHHPDHHQVADATSAVANVDDYSGSARLLAATTLRNLNIFVCLQESLWWIFWCLLSLWTICIVCTCIISHLCQSLSCLLVFILFPSLLLACFSGFHTFLHSRLLWLCLNMSSLL